MVDLVAFGIVIDDVVLPDGSLQMGLLGGGGPQAAFGMRLLADSVGLSTRVGEDLPPAALKWLDQSGIDRRGVQVTDLPTPRAWQRLEPDGRRTQEWRVNPEVISAQLKRSIDALPADYRQAQGFHYGIHLETFDLQFVRDLKSLGAVISVETFKAAEAPVDRNRLGELLNIVDIFSPNLVEAESLAGPGSPQQLIQRLGQYGGQVILLRMGQQGALVSEDGGKNVLHIPAYPVKAANHVGAGNAFCGGFLAGWCQGRGLRIAGLYAAVAASFLLEAPELPEVTISLREEARNRIILLDKLIRVEP